MSSAHIHARQSRKYREWGAYHWKEFARPSIYRAHALKVQIWITERPVIDIGCGDGLISHLLDCEGIDIDPLAVEMAVERGVRARVGSVYDLSGHWAAAYLGDTLEHLDLPEKALRQIATVTGILYVATPPKRRSKPYRATHVIEWTPEELVQFLSENGWELTGDTEVANDRTYGRFECRKSEYAPSAA